jgi:molybdenum cofactor biosynthesis protein B
MRRMSTAEHRRQAPASVSVHVITVSDTRTPETDTSGTAIAELLTSAGHVLAGRTLLKDEPAQVRETVARLVADASVDAVITTGGTGITARDGTFEALDSLLEKRLDGFGELFRMLSYQEIGAAAMLSRATAGLAGRTIVLALPGSEHAVRLAMEKLILPELGHLVREARR